MIIDLERYIGRLMTKFERNYVNELIFEISISHVNDQQMVQSTEESVII